MATVLKIADEYQHVSSARSSGGKRPPVANRTSSHAYPTAKASARASVAAKARPASIGRLSSSKRGAASTALATAGNGSRPTTPDTPTKESGKRSPSAPPPAVARTQPETRFTETREKVCTQLSATPFLQHGHPLFMHGRGYTGPRTAAKVTWKSDKPPRKDHDTPEWLTATEFEDTREVAVAKCRQLASLLRLSKKTVLYTGAGISASVIGQAALSGQNTVGWKPDKMKAKPTLTHHALGFLGRQGIVHSWVQQNHDGLPQKAGFPQECINEIHGSWYDPGNPVVKYSGTLHSRSCPWMENDAETADLVLVLGTSLGGLNADQVATGAADRSQLPQGALGTVCINLQQTAEDGKMTLRMFGRSDDLLPMLLHELGFPPLRPAASHWPQESRALVPYDSKGKRLAEGAPKMWLDLSDGMELRITAGHNIQGAKQPQYMHIGAKKPVEREGKTLQPGPGLGCVKKRDDEAVAFMLNIEGAQMRLGLWWLDAAIRGAVEVLPIVNQNPVFEGSQPKASVRTKSAR